MCRQVCLSGTLRRFALMGLFSSFPTTSQLADHTNLHLT